MQQVIFLIIGLLVGYLFFRVNKLSRDKTLIEKQENLVENRSSKEPKKISHPSIGSQRLQAGGRDYFFDLRTTNKGDKYLHITESRLKDGEEIRGNIVIFQDHIDNFLKKLEEMVKKI